MSGETSAATTSRRVSAVVVSYFTGPVLARCLASLKAEPEVAEIILVDNGNWPGSVADAIAAAGPDGAAVTTLSGHGNVGFATACNLGAKAATGEHLFFLNPDAMIERGGVGRLLADAESLPRPWMIGCKLVGPDGVEQQGSRRATLTPWRAFVEATRLYAVAPRHPYFRRFNLHQDPCPKTLVALPAISGACFFLPREDYFAVGGMDERYFLHAEDLDFCFRFARSGGQVLFDPFVTVSHFKSSSRANAMRVEFRKTASILRYFRTHFSEPYPPPFMALVGAALWSVFLLKASRRAVTRTVGYAAALPRVGGAGFRRTLQLAARRRQR